MKQERGVTVCTALQFLLCASNESNFVRTHIPLSQRSLAYPHGSTNIPDEIRRHYFLKGCIRHQWITYEEIGNLPFGNSGRERLYQSVGGRGDLKMAVFVRSKQINYPLNERVKACLCGGYDHNTGNYSSGSEYECISDSFSSHLLCGFLEDVDDQNPKTENKDKEEEKGSENDVNKSEGSMEAIRHVISSIQVDVYQRDLWTSVRKIVEKELLSNSYAVPRTVMVELRDLGYNAGLCKTKWVGCGSLIAGNYEYIDVIKSENGVDQRYFVGLNFRGEFVIANPTQEYNRILPTLPEIFVGKSKDLKQVIKLVCRCMKISLKSRDLHLPPWRKSKYIQAKWFSSYKRTTNHCSSKVVGHKPNPIQCRSTGFILNY